MFVELFFLDDTSASNNMWLWVIICKK